MFDFTYINLNFTWFVLIGILFGGYAVLDGFDMGVGALHLLAKTDEERRLMLNSIGPVWDGNEVWLVTAGGALFATFPEAYATLVSGFYAVVMILLFSLIFRAIAIEFRSKQPMPWWRQFWDISFSLASILASFTLGVSMGNLIRGIPINSAKSYTGGFFELFHPYAVLVGFTTVAIFVMHGSIYIALKTEGTLHDKAKGWIKKSLLFFVICYILTTVATIAYVPYMTEKSQDHSVLYIIPAITLAAIANIPRQIDRRHYFKALLSSGLVILFLLLTFGIGVYPNILLSTTDPSFSLTIYNSASSVKSLNYTFNFAVLALPFVVGYTIAVYWIFGGKVKISKDSY